MTDNVIVSANIGTGATVATDDINGVQHQRVKLTLGADGVSDGDVSATNPMPVAIQGKNSSTGAHEDVWKDAFTGAIVQIEIPHAAIHIGKYFSHSGIVTVANNASYEHLIRTPAPGGKWIHFRLFLFDTTSAPIRHFLYEDAVVTSAGTVQVGYSFNRNFANATVGLYHTPTLSADGTLIHTAQIAGTKQSGGAGQTSGTEWVLKQGADYLSRITNVSGQSADIGYIAEWYEL